MAEIIRDHPNAEGIVQAKCDLGGEHWVSREEAEFAIEGLGKWFPNDTLGGLRGYKTIIALYNENAELRRWLGAAAELIEEPYWEPFENALRGVSAHRTSSTFRALSRGEQVLENVRRMYLGDEE